jgi:hypothetical protein
MEYTLMDIAREYGQPTDRVVRYRALRLGLPVGRGIKYTDEQKDRILGFKAQVRIARGTWDGLYDHQRELGYVTLRMIAKEFGVDQAKYLSRACKEWFGEEWPSLMISKLTTPIHPSTAERIRLDIRIRVIWKSIDGAYRFEFPGAIDEWAVVRAGTWTKIYPVD